MATLAKAKNELADTKFAVSAVDEHIALFGKPPVAYATAVVGALGMLPP